jgi:hypothetical protein
LGSKISSAGHKRVQIDDPQIVNGLQTSREIFNHFAEDIPLLESRTVLVRVIETNDAEVTDSIIRATNSQNRMQESSLRMTDTVHRKIEDLLKPYNIFYDRRKGFYKDQGVPIDKIVSPTSLAQAVIAILLQRPDDARGRPGNYFKNEQLYQTIFGDDRLPLPVYLACLRIMGAAENYLDTLDDIERADVRNLMFYVGAQIAVDITQQLAPTPQDLMTAVTSSVVDGKVVIGAYQRVSKVYQALAKKSDRDAVGRGSEFIRKLRAQSKRRLSPKMVIPPAQLELKGGGVST